MNPTDQYNEFPPKTDTPINPVFDPIKIQRGQIITLPEGTMISRLPCGMEQFHSAQAEWSQATFGPDSERGAIGPLKHLAKELLSELLGVPLGIVESFLCMYVREEGQPKQRELFEYVDAQFLLFDASRRDGYTYEQLLEACWVKLAINQRRTWVKKGVNEPMEHDRTLDSTDTI